MKKILIIPFMLLLLCSCNSKNTNVMKERDLVDTVGFASNPAKMDLVMDSLTNKFGNLIRERREAAGITPGVKFKTVISPHDDYAYVSYLYPLCLEPVKARTVILIGVAHKAKDFDLENQLVFDSFDRWKSAYGPVTISPLRNEIIHRLKKESYVVHDSMQAVEHSLEAIVPFLQYYNHEVEIIPVLVPYMSYERAATLAGEFAQTLQAVAQKHQLEWGDDYALVISTDAVHYGDREWGGSDFAFMGADSAGYEKAVAHEHQIISDCLTGWISPDRFRRFTEYTLDPDDYKQYQWTWCGRYSVPFGLQVSYDLGQLQHVKLNGQLLDYSTSIAGRSVDFSNNGMGVTAVANIHHWVGYAAVGYR